jgi:hypothetical protein
VKNRWDNLVTAYTTLSKDRKMYDNWRQYGHPDGALSIKVVELMMPSFLMDPVFRPMVLTGGFMLCIAVVLYFAITLQRSSYDLQNGISHVSKQNMKDMLLAVLEDNDKEQRTKGATDGDIRAIYQNSENGARQCQNLPDHVPYDSIFLRMQGLVNQGQTLVQKASGDACCGGPSAPESHEQILAEYLPRLNEVLFDIIQEDTHLQQGIFMNKG